MKTKKHLKTKALDSARVEKRHLSEITLMDERVSPKGSIDGRSQISHDEGQKEIFIMGHLVIQQPPLEEHEIKTLDLEGVLDLLIRQIQQHEDELEKLKVRLSLAEKTQHANIKNWYSADA